MNRKFILFLLGTKIQDFMASALNFGFLLIFYNQTGSVFYAGTLTAVSVIISRIVMFFLIPLLKPYSPMKVSAGVSMVMGTAALVATLLSYFLSKQIFFYLSFLVIFSIIQEVSRSFTNSILPRIVDKDYLFKANSVNGIFFNLSQILAPMFSYFFKATNMTLIFLIYSLISMVSSIVMFILYRLDSETNVSPPVSILKRRNLGFYSSEWVKTFRLIFSNSNILFCIAIGVSINIIFAGINGPFLLKMGGDNLGATLIKVSLSVGSLLGVYGAFFLRIKERYNEFLKISIFGIVGTLLFLIVVNQPVVLLFGMMILTIFVMFIMNSTGTFLQLVTPLQEIPAVYEFRSTLYAIVVPLSYVFIGWLLDHWSYRVYFAISIFLILQTWFIKIRMRVQLNPQE